MYRWVLAGIFIAGGAATAWGNQVLRESETERFYRGQTHLHTLWSDGDGAPELAIYQYKEIYGFDFAVISDHNIVPDHERWFAIEEGDSKRLTPERFDQLVELFGAENIDVRDTEDGREMRLKTIDELKEMFDEDEKFLLMLGEEVTARVHINAINLREHIPPVLQTEDNVYVIRKTYEAVEAQSKRFDIPMMAHVNHPNFSTGVSPDDFIQAIEANYFEVYNGHGSVRNWGDPDNHMYATDRIWDIALAFRLIKDRDNVMLGVATDDTHNYHWRGRGRSIPNRGWVQVLAPKLQDRALVEAMLQGRFYASCGVTLEEVVPSDRDFTVKIAAEEGVTYTTQFIGTTVDFDQTATPILDDDGNPVENNAMEYSEDIGRVLYETTDNPATYTFTGDEIYVRAKIISDKLMTDPFMDGDPEMAWTQPVVLPAKE